MISGFYKCYSGTILLIVALSFPFLVIQADSLPVNNNIETWLPERTEVRGTYEEFKQIFGADEVILVGISAVNVDERLLEALSQRLERLESIRRCWSPSRLRHVMQELGVPDEEIHDRLNGFLVSEDGKMLGLLAVLSEQGLEDRSATVTDVRRQVDYSQLRGDAVSLAGAPVIVSELDRLGSKDNNHRFFLITLLICLCLLYYSVRQWKVTLTILGLTVWAINLTRACVYWAGGEMNFILGALSVMVMIFTLAVAIHLLHYFRSCQTSDEPLGDALRLAWKPCFLATLTTAIGLVSLTVSDILPVRQFGYAGGIGSFVALLTGLGLVPAALARWPLPARSSSHTVDQFQYLANWLVMHSRRVTLVAGGLVLATGFGMLWLESSIDPRDFLPRDGKALADIRRVEEQLASPSSIEAIVDFGSEERPFADKLHEVRRLETIIQSHPSVRHTTSAATFFPNEMPASAVETTSLLNRARSRQQDSDYVAEGGRLWRISAGVTRSTGYTRQQTFDELSASLADAPVTLTGVSPMLEQAQRAIFDGFWESFGIAFGVITVVMIVSLRSLKTGLVAMIPNLTPICLVFGILGWLNFPVDVGMMMTGSIALGIAVDGTFHFLVRYNELMGRTKNSTIASRDALVRTGAAIFKAAVIASIGMLALTLSTFVPTARFGYMMAALLTAALVGDLVLLPAVLCLRTRAEESAQAISKVGPRRPHYLDQTRRTPASAE